MKDLPPAPPKKLLRIKTEEVLEKVVYFVLFGYWCLCALLFLN